MMLHLFYADSLSIVCDYQLNIGKDAIQDDDDNDSDDENAESTKQLEKGSK